MSNATTSSTPEMTIGLDLGDRLAHYAVLDLKGELVASGRLRTTSSDFQAFFAHLKPARVVLEAGSQSPWTSRLLALLGHEVVVANPRRVQLIAKNPRKSDKVDAETLARLGRLDPRLLQPVLHRDEQAQAALALIRSRHALVASRTLLINHVRGAVKSFGSVLPRCDAHSFHLHAPSALPEELHPALVPLIQTIADLTLRIRSLDREIEGQIAETYPEADLLRQVPGVGPLTALAFVLVIQDPSRFARSRDAGAYLGLVPRQRQSGSRDPQLGISKCGDAYLRSLLVECAHFILSSRSPDSDLKRWGLAHLQAGDHVSKRRAVVGVARKLAVLLHHLWWTGEVYQPLRLQEESEAVIA